VVDTYEADDAVVECANGILKTEWLYKMKIGTSMQNPEVVHT